MESSSKGPHLLYVVNDEHSHLTEAHISFSSFNQRLNDWRRREETPGQGVLLWREVSFPGPSAGSGRSDMGPLEVGVPWGWTLALQAPLSCNWAVLLS